MQYLGIDLHRKQLTVSLRNPNGDVLLRRQVSTRWPKLEEFRDQLHEALAAGEASRRFPPEELARFTLYSNAEPCAMCAGAIYWAGLGRVVFGLAERDLLAATGDHPDNPTLNLPCREVFGAGQREIAVIGPALEDEARVVFEGYFG